MPTARSIATMRSTSNQGKAAVARNHSPAAASAGAGTCGGVGTGMG